MSSSRLATARLSALVAVLGSALVACGGPQTHSAHGIVQEVLVSERQVVISHDEIPGLMPAMSMNFTIYDEALLGSLQAGDVIDFELVSSRRSFYIESATVVGQVALSDGWARLGDVLVRADPAPDFDLTDQASARVRLSDLAGKTVLLDFIFTHCTGPCPILTSRHVSVERELADSLRDKTRFVSISIDPERDTPEALARYGLARGADLDHWSFLTGTRPAVDEVLRAYGVAATRSDGAEIEHVVVTFLINPAGQIVKRYLGLDASPEEIAADLAAIAQ